MHVVPEPINAEDCAKLCKLYQTLPDCPRIVLWAVSFGGSADWRQGRLVYRITQLSSSTKSFYCDTEVFGNIWQPLFLAKKGQGQQGQRHGGCLSDNRCIGVRSFPLMSNNQTKYFKNNNSTSNPFQNRRNIPKLTSN